MIVANIVTADAASMGTIRVFITFYFFLRYSTIVYIKFFFCQRVVFESMVSVIYIMIACYCLIYEKIITATFKLKDID